jgi:hypothetical protein
MKNNFILAFTIVLFSQISFSQQNKLKLNLDKSGETYIKASARMQLWARYYDTNPNSTINEEITNNVMDFSVRRIRMSISSQVTPKLYVATVFGGNNINQQTEKNFTLKILDLYAVYQFSKAFGIGFGESGWEGLSRWNLRSTKSLMTLDAPSFNLLTVNKNDDHGRSLGIWFKGKIGKIDYRFALKNPVQYGVNAKESIVDYAINKPRKKVSGYLKYEFLEPENNTSAYSDKIGTYLGKKQVFNIGVGFMNQPKMTSQLINNVEKFYDFKNWAIDVFYDTPINKEKGTAFTTYLGYFNTDFGPNYIRNVGANDVTTGGTSFNGSGNHFPMIGTGNTVFFQFGYLLSKNKNNHQFQPNLAIQYSNFEALNDTMIVYNLGVNYYINGHSNKLSLNYENRPVFQTINNNLKVDERKGMIVLQYQIEIN